MNRCLICFNMFALNLDYYELLIPQKNQKKNICPNCLQKFEALTDNVCKNCSRPLKEPQNLCSNCQYWSQKYQGNLLSNKSLYKYNQAFHDLMVQYKRYGDYELRMIFKDLITTLPAADLYVPIPSSPSHLKKRGFETIESIYKEKVRLTFLLDKLDHESAQGEKGMWERLNSKQTFRVKKKIQVSNSSSVKILLLDDIYTTGRTLYHARDALRSDFPCTKIESFTLAH